MKPKCGIMVNIIGFRILNVLKLILEKISVENAILNSCVVQTYDTLNANAFVNGKLLISNQTMNIFQF